jgi:hypothetical protein
MHKEETISGERLFMSASILNELPNQHDKIKKELQ